MNYTIDPLWLFDHENSLNKKQLWFDERQQKTNAVRFRDFSAFNAVLVGSSRASYVNQEDFKELSLFNYALSSMYPYEYKAYIDFFQSQIDAPLDTIVLGLDFFGVKEAPKGRFEAPSFYIQRSSEYMYRYKTLLSIDLFLKSVKTLRNSGIHYDRQLIKHRPIVSEKVRARDFKKNLKKHIANFQDDKFILNPNYEQELRSLKEAYPNTNFIVYTSPITAELLVSIIKKADRWDEYEQWLRTIVDLFGSVHHFKDINSITTNLNNYPDDDHLYPQHLSHVVRFIEKDTSSVPSDFGVVLNSENLDAYLVECRSRVLRH